MPMASAAKPHLFLFTGSDTFSISEKVRYWNEEFKKKYPNSAMVTLDGEEEERDDNDAERRLKRISSAQGLFATQRLIVIKNAHACSDPLIELLASMPHTDFVVCIAPTLPTRSKLATLFKRLEKEGVGKHDMFEPPSGSRLTTWIKNRATLLELRLSSSSLSYLCVRLVEQHASRFSKQEVSLWELSNHLHALAYRTKGRGCEKADIDEVIPLSIEGHAFTISDAIAEGDASSALRLSRALLESEPPSQIKSACIALFAFLKNQWLGLSLVQSGSGKNISDAELGNALSWNPKRVWLVKRKQQKNALAKLTACAFSFIFLDSKLKNQSLNARAACDATLVKACRTMRSS